MGEIETSRTDGRESADGVVRGTGRSRDEWFTVLDDWGAVDRPYREIAGWLAAHHDLSDWWAQKLTVEYEQARGLRAPGVRPDGTFTITVSKTVAAGVERLFEAFVEDAVRERWLPGAVMRERTSKPGRSARFDWEDGSTRVNVGFAAAGGSKSRVGLEHQGLADPDAARSARDFWRERLGALGSLLEA
jgi:hypothetical protein